MSDTFMGHPKGLFICFLTEMWERFAYYGMLSLLVLYLTKIYLLSDDEGNKIVAAYGALIWMLPVVGGLVADRLLGSRKAVVLGALMMAVGYFSISFPVMFAWLFSPGNNSSALDEMFFSMAVISVGVGFLKSNISTVVGALYTRDDPRRDSGFTIFYMGINIGGALGPIVCGGIGHWFGMQYGFAAVGVGMLIALVTFLYGKSILGNRIDPPNPQVLRKKVLLGINVEWIIYICALLLVVVLWQALNWYEIMSETLLWFAAALGLFIIYFSVFRCEPIERDRMLAVTTLIAFAIIFWSLYMQMFGSLTLFSDRLVDREMFGTEIAASQLNGMPSIFVVALAPLFSLVWFRLAKRKRNPNIPVKFAISLVLCGLAFMMPALGQGFSDDGRQISLFWFLMTFFLMVTGELCQAPISMNMVTRLCPRRVVGMMIGAYFVSLAIGSVVSGELAARYTGIELNADGSLVDAVAALETYASAYWMFGGVAVATGVLLYLLSPFLYRRMHDQDEAHGDSYISQVYRRAGIIKS